MSAHHRDHDDPGMVTDPRDLAEQFIALHRSDPVAWPVEEVVHRAALYGWHIGADGQVEAPIPPPPPRPALHVIQGGLSAGGNAGTGPSAPRPHPGPKRPRREDSQGELWQEVH